MADFNVLKPQDLQAFVSHPDAFSKKYDLLTKYKHTCDIFINSEKI